MLVIDPDLLDEFRAKRECEYCHRKVRGCHPHHCFARGMANGGRLDIRRNIISLCAHCHSATHHGQIARDDLLRLVARRENCTTDEIIAEVALYRRTRG